MAWVEAAKNCVGVTRESVWCDLAGSQQRSSDAYQVAGRARDPERQVFWAPFTVFDPDMFRAPDEVLQHIDAADWHELHFPYAVQYANSAHPLDYDF